MLTALSQIPSLLFSLFNSFDDNNDGSYPTTAWQFVVSKISGDLPDLTVKSNRAKKEVHQKKTPPKESIPPEKS